MVILNSAALSLKAPVLPDCSMLAILEHWEETGGDHVDNTLQYLFLMLLKLGLEILILSLCWCRPHTSFLGVCSLSVFLVDTALVWAIATLWFLGPDQSPVSLCFVLAHASSIYAMLPLPMMVLGLLDYLHELGYSSCRGALCRTLQNCVLALLVWVMAGMCSFCSTDTLVTETEYMAGRKALACQTQGSTLVSIYCTCLLIAACCVLLPFSSWLPTWLREANRLSAKRDNSQKHPECDLHFLEIEPGSGVEKEMAEETGRRPIPPLYVSLTLCFTTTWMPYLVISIACQLMGFMVPAYITVNLLWFECAKSLLVGTVLWLKDDNVCPYSDLPDSVCQWGIYWDLSKGPKHAVDKHAVYQDRIFCRPATFQNENPLLNL